MISIIFLILASISNSVMDVCSFHYNNSVFNKLNPKFWNQEISWKSKYKDWDNGDNRRKKIFGTGINYPVQFTDSWHFFKSLSIVFICISIATFDCNFLAIIESQTLRTIIIIGIYGTAWNVTFSLFYNFILLKIKKYKK